MKQYPCLLLLLLFLTINGKSQSPISKEYPSKIIGAHPLVWDLVYDGKGIGWFANNNGLLRYDGHNWHLFKIPLKVRSIQPDLQGNLWLAGIGDFGMAQVEVNGNLSYTSYKKQLPGNAQFTGGNEKVISDGNLTFFTTTNYMAQVENNQITLIPNSTYQGAFIFKGKLFVNSQAGLARWENQKLTLVSGSSLLAGQQITAETKTEKGIYLASNLGKLFYFNGQELKPIVGEAGSFASLGVIGLCLTNEPKPKLAIASLHQGVRVFDEALRFAYTIKTASSEIYALGKDPENNLWIGHAKGICQSLNAPLFELNTSPEMGTINHLKVNNHKVYIAATGGLFSIDLSKLFQSANRVANCTGECWQVESYLNALYVASTEGVYKINHESSTLLLPGETILRIQKGNKSNKLYLMGSNGVWYLDPITGSIVPLKGAPLYANSVYEIKENQLLFGTFTNGLATLNSPIQDSSFKEGEIIIRTYKQQAFLQKGNTVYTLDFKEAEGIPFELFSGSYKVGDEEGPVLFNLSEASLKILELGNWVQTALIHAVEGRPTAIDANDSYYFLATEDQLFMAKKEMPWASKPTAYVSLIEKPQNEIIYLACFQNFLVSKGAAQTYIPELKYHENPISIQLGLTAYAMAGQQLFNYKLDESTHWSGWQKEARITLPQLSGGKHVLILKAKDAYGNETPESTFEFYIHPPWYKSGIAYLCYLLGLMLLIYIIHKISQKQLLTRNLLLEKKVKERTAELSSEKAKSDGLLLNILPAEVAEELKNTGGLQARQFDNVSILFTDFVGFTTLSQKLTPTQLVEEIHFCFKAFDDIIEKHNLEKIKTIGDAYLAVCGLPKASPDHATRVARAALDIKQFMERYQAERKAEGKYFFEVKIGINSGPVVAGIVGVKKYAYDIWGDTVNTAARMEQNCEAGKINLSGSTFELIKNQYNCSYRGKIDAKNKGMIDMYYLLSL